MGMNVKGHDVVSVSFSISAFFVGLLYFLAQWSWKMAEVKSGSGLPAAYALILATATSGACSFHGLLMYGAWPPLRIRIVNALLFLPFLLIGTFSYERARLEMMDLDPKFAGTGWYEQQGFVVVCGVLGGCLPFLVSLGIKKWSEPASREPTNPDS